MGYVAALVGASHPTLAHGDGRHLEDDGRHLEDDGRAEDDEPGLKMTGPG